MAHGRDPVTDPFTAFFTSIKAAQICRRSDFSRSDFDDLKQGMMQYLLEKQGGFDPDRGSPEAFVTVAVNTWIAMHLRHRGRDQRRCDTNAISLDHTTIEGDDDPVPLASMICEEDLGRRTGASALSAVEHLELVEAVRHAMAKLSPEEAAILELVAERGVTGAIHEWARLRGETRSRCWVTRQMTGMRRRFEDSGLSAN